jgi:hypothetical protein
MQFTLHQGTYPIALLFFKPELPACQTDCYDYYMGCVAVGSFLVSTPVRTLTKPPRLNLNYFYDFDRLG